MSFIPEIVSPRYSELRTRMDYSHIYDLKFPRDRKGIARLSLNEKQVWYAAQDPQRLIDYGSAHEFPRFWFWHYIVPLKLKRWVFLLKFW